MTSLSCQRRAIKVQTQTAHIEAGSVFTDFGGWEIRAVIQRVRDCSVEVRGKRISRIGEGMLVFLGVAPNDGSDEIEYLADRIVNLRIFPDENNRMNLSLLEIGGDIMVVSQFTLLADCKKGRRPSFSGAASPDYALDIYERFLDKLRDYGLRVECGKFGEEMMVSLSNWGPVTFVLDVPPLQGSAD